MAKPRRQLKTVLIAILSIIVFAIAYLIFKNKEDNKGSDINSTSKEKIVNPMQDGVKMKTISRPKNEKLNKAKPLQRDTSNVKEKTDIQHGLTSADQNKEKNPEKESNSTEVTL